MKFIYITCNVSMLEELLFTIDQLELGNYQVIEQVTAKSSYSTPRLNTPIWPGYNSSIVIQEQDSTKVDALLKEIHKMNEMAFNDSEFIALHAWEVTDYILPPLRQK